MGDYPYLRRRRKVCAWMIWLGRRMFSRCILRSLKWKEVFFCAVYSIQSCPQIQNEKCWLTVHGVEINDTASLLNELSYRKMYGLLYTTRWYYAPCRSIDKKSVLLTEQHTLLCKSLIFNPYTEAGSLDFKAIACVFPCDYIANTKDWGRSHEAPHIHLQHQSYLLSTV